MASKIRRMDPEGSPSLLGASTNSERRGLSGKTGSGRHRSRRGLNADDDDTSSFPATEATRSLIGKSFSHATSTFFPQKTQEERRERLVDELREARRKRNTTTGLESRQNDFDVPASAYSAACPLEVFCGVSPTALPCGESPMMQGVFGNKTDLASRQATAADGDSFRVGPPGVSHARQKHDTSVTCGFPTLVERGWEPVPEPQVLRLAQDEISRHHLTLAYEMFGASFLKRPTDSEEHCVVSFKKEQVPGTSKDVEATVKKLKRLDTANVVKLVEACESESEYFFIYEVCSGAGLIPMRALSHRDPMSAQEAARLLQQLSAIVGFAARVQMHHLDISIWNAMSATHRSVFPVKLWGVGLAGVMYRGRDTKGEALDVLRGAFYYRPPELCRIWLDPEVECPYKKIDGSIRTATDVFSVAAVCFTAIAGHPPHGGTDETEVMQRIIGGRVEFGTEFAHVEASGIEVLQRGMSWTPAKRPRPEAMISDAWTGMHLRSAIPPDLAQKTVENLRAFVFLPRVMRAIGTVVSSHLTAQELSPIEETFNTFDTLGDGELEAQEICSFIAEGRDEVKELFKAMDTDGNGRLSLGEFVVANVFAGDLLTERILIRTFSAFDVDGAGEISPLELYTVLTKFDEKLTAADVASLMGDLDRDWDMKIDLQEFRGFFPQVASRQAELDNRMRQSAKVLEICQQVFGHFVAEAEHWKSLVAEELEKSKQLKQISVEGDATTAANCTREWLSSVLSCLKKVAFCVKRPPRLFISPEALESYKTNSEFAKAQQRKQLHQKGHRHHRNHDHDLGSERQALRQEKGGKEAAKRSGINVDDLSGPCALDHFFRAGKAAWSRTLSSMISVAENLEVVESKVRRRTEMLRVLTDLDRWWKDLCNGHVASCDEQRCMLEAMLVEETMPKVNNSARCIIRESHETREACEAVQRYRRERAAARTELKEKDTQKSDEQHDMTEVKSECLRRGMAWAAKYSLKGKSTYSAFGDHGSGTDGGMISVVGQAFMNVNGAIKRISMGQ